MSPPKLETLYSSSYFEVRMTTSPSLKNIRVRAVPPNPRTPTGPPGQTPGY